MKGPPPYQMQGEPLPGPKGRSGWRPIMERPIGFPGCPPGLEYLIPLDQLFIKQKKEILEIITDYETQNKYVVLNSLGQQVYYIREVSSICCRQCCSNLRSFEMQVEDASGMVMRFVRPYKQECIHPMCSCCPNCMDRITVEAPPGVLVGEVNQKFNCCRPSYSITNEKGATVLQITGPHYLACRCPCTNIDFQLKSANSSAVIGTVSKKWSNLLQEIFTDANNFGISFPKDLSVKMKAVVLAACMLIDFMFFEEDEERKVFE